MLKFLRKLFSRRRISLDILHNQEGHSTISFDANDPDAVERANDQITDLLKLGYSLFVTTDKGEERVTGFDPKTSTYKIGSKEVKAEEVKPKVVAPTAGGCPAATN